MKNITLILLLFFPFFCCGQQILWSTTKIADPKYNDVKLISISAVTEKILDYYEFYKYYHDLSGFSKDGIEEFLKKDSNVSKSIKWNSSMMVDEPFAIAFKGNEGKGSVIIVMLVQKENIDLILFANEIGKGAIRSYPGDIDKFEKWLGSFWDYHFEKHRAEDLVQSKTDVVEYGLENRRYVIRPNIVSKGEYSGRVMVEIAVNRQGKVISARAGVRGSTIVDPKLNLECEQALLKAQFNELKDAPEIQRGSIVFNFKSR